VLPSFFLGVDNPINQVILVLKLTVVKTIALHVKSATNYVALDLTVFRMTRVGTLFNIFMYV